jgi:hypothetical protein
MLWMKKLINYTNLKTSSWSTNKNSHIMDEKIDKLKKS